MVCSNSDSELLKVFFFNSSYDIRSFIDTGDDKQFHLTELVNDFSHSHSEPNLTASHLLRASRRNNGKPILHD